MNRVAVSDKKQGRSPGEWISYLKSKNAPKNLIDQIKGIEESGKKYNKSKEYIMRTIIDKIPEKYLKEPTGVHGKGKSGPLSKEEKKKSSEYDMSSNSFQFMGVQDMDDLINKHTALEKLHSDPIDNINKDIDAINNLLVAIKLPEEERKMLLFLIEDIIEIAKEAIIGKKEGI